MFTKKRKKTNKLHEFSWLIVIIFRSQPLHTDTVTQLKLRTVSAKGGKYV